VLLELSVPLDDVLNGDGIEKTVDSLSDEKEEERESATRFAFDEKNEKIEEKEEETHSVDKGNHDVGGNRLVLSLLEELSETGTTGEEETGGGIEIGTELAGKEERTEDARVSFLDSSKGPEEMKLTRRRRPLGTERGRA